MKSTTSPGLIAVLFSLTITQGLKAQHNEVILQTESGLFALKGNLVTDHSVFNIGTDFQGRDISYTNNPFSPKSGFSYGFSVQAQHLTKGRFIYGIQVNYESLATRTQITEGYASGVAIPFVEGHSTIRHQYVNLHPLLGYRWGQQAWQLDLSIGLDFALGSSTTETGRAFTASRQEYTTHRALSVPPFDQRPRIDLTAYYHRFGISVGYARGTTNYIANLSFGSSYAIYDQVWRAGLVYRILQ